MPPKKNNKPQSKNKEGGIIQDSRFKHVHSDPRFVRPKKRDAKVKIDQRFAAMLKNKEFSDAPSVDKYGRKLKEAVVKDDLKRFYDLEDEDLENVTDSGDDLESSEPEDSEEEEEEEQEEEGPVAQSSEEDSESDAEEAPGYDPMRGEGVSSSSEEESEVGEEDEEDEEDVPTGDETRRFAVINLDWDNVKSVDLFKVFNGFMPEGGAIKSVKIYPSEFGKERLEKEAREGPPSEIFKPLGSDEESETEQADEDEPLVQADSGEEFDMNKLRKYQLERLKYYYAVVECDTVQTARAIYKQCDGTEYESSANFFDLRFIPDDMEFSDEPRDEAYNAPAGYKPMEFTTQALQHSKVKLTWDDDDVDRIRVTRQKFSKQDLEEMDFKAYIASSSDSDSDEEDVEEIKRKYKNLLAQAEQEKEEADDQDMEITFAPGLSEAATELLEKKKQKEQQENETSIEAYMRKQKERRQKKKQAKKSQEESQDEEQNQLFSDDEVDIDESDPFFQSEMAGEFAPKSSKTSGAKSKKNKKLTAEEKAEEAKKQAELELLVMDADDGRKHFNMKDIIKKEKKKGKKGKKTVEDTDEFEINVSDPRFTALHESHHFAIDPTNPQFKKTKAMTKLLEERQRRRVTSSNAGEEPVESVQDKPQTKVKDASISRLVDSIKRKATSNVASSGKRKKSTK